MMDQLRFFKKSIARSREVDWEAAYHADLPRLYNFFRYRVGDSHVAEDLTAETFTRAWRDRHRYRYDLAAFSTWLFTIARQVVADYFRKPHLEVPLADAGDIAAEETVESLVQQRSDFERLSMLLSKLTDHDRELFALKYGAGLTNRMIAQLNGMTESNVGTTLHRLTQQLRLAWEKEP
jgi:RNA polymerase sigma-70 factor (ECF subfamily)